MDAGFCRGSLDVSAAPVFRSPAKGFYELSSGEKALFQFACLLLSCEDSCRLLLVDEPENHLHPQFIVRLMRILSSGLTAIDGAAIVVTHSPFVIRELDRSFVYVLKRRNGSPIPIFLRPSLQTLGASISEVADYVFEDTHTVKGYQTQVDALLADADDRAKKDVVRQVGERFGKDALAYAIDRSKTR